MSSESVVLRLFTSNMVFQVICAVDPYFKVVLLHALLRYGYLTIGNGSVGRVYDKVRPLHLP